MQSSFDRSLAAVFRSEGGYVNHKDDPGGPTNRGITLANFRRYVDPKGDIAALKALTTEQAAIVYRRQYWDAVSGDQLPAGVDHAIFDFGVNSGPSRAIKFLQRALGVAADGVIGPVTLKAVRAADPATVAAAVCDARLAWLKTLSTWGTFGKGWGSRVASVRKLSLALAAEASNQPAEHPIAIPAPDTPATPETPAPEQPEAKPDGWEVDWGKVALAVAIGAVVAAGVAFFF